MPARSVKVGEIEIEPVATLEPLRQEWTEPATRNRSVFKTWEWLSTWWDHFGQHRALMVAAVWSQDRLVGILPLYRWRHAPCGPCGFLGHAVGDELGPVCAPADRPLMASAFTACWGSRAGTCSARSRSQRTRTGAACLAAVSWPGRATRSSSSALMGGRASCAGGAPTSRSRSGDDRGSWLGSTRCATAWWTGPQDLQPELDTLFRLHAPRWAATPSGLLAHQGSHHAVARLAAQRGWLRLWILEIEDQAAAAVYGFRFAGVESYYQAGRDPRWDRYHVGLILLAHAIQQAAHDSVAEYRLLRGGEQYKYRFATADPGLETVGVSHGPGRDGAAGAEQPADGQGIARPDLTAVDGPLLPRIDLQRGACRGSCTSS